MRKIILRIGIVCLTMLLSGGVLAGGWTMPWDQKWTMPWDASQDARTDLVPVLVGVTIMPHSELLALCGDTRGMRGCATDTQVFLEGKERSEATALFKVQYHATYKTLRAECGSAKPCFNDNILHTLEFNTRGPRSELRMGQIGDLINKAFDMGIPYNKRVTFAQLFMGLLSS